MIRADSWMGAETAFAFPNEVRVAAGATLTVEDGAEVTFDGGLTVEDGGTLVVEPGAAFAVGENQTLLAESGGSVVIAPGAEVTVEPGAVVRGASGSQLAVGAGATVRLGMKASVEAAALTAVGTGAAPVLFTRLSPGDAWERILLTGTADLAHDLRHVRIEGAEVGLDVRARGTSPNAAGAALTNVQLVGNGIGLLADYAPAVGGSGSLWRSRFSLHRVLVEKSDTYGLFLRNADFSLHESTVRDNGGHGVFVTNATATAFFDNVIEDNGTNTGSYDGLRVEANGEVDLNRRGDVVGSGEPGRNRIARNDDHQVAYLPGAYLFMGAGGFGGGLNTVTEPGTGCRVYNDSGSILEAENNYWGTTSAPPSGYFCGSYSVDANPYLTADPTGGSGGGYRPAPGGEVLLASAAATATVNRGGDDDPIAVLRARIRAVRAEVAEHPSAEAAPALVRLLAGLHRLDVWDETGEAAATEQVLRVLRDHLGEGHPESLPPGLRRTAESAAVVALEGALAGEDYERADGLLAAFEPVVEDAGHALGLSAVSVEEAHERYEAALGRLGGLMAVVGEGHDGLAGDLAFLAEVIAAKAEAAGRGSEGAGDAGAVASRSGDGAALPVAYALGPVYPNPAVAQVTVPFDLPEVAEVRVAVYDLLGRQVAVLAEGLREAGRHALALDGSGLSAGVYVVRASLWGNGASHVLTRRITLVR